jgi:hypothetical protein
MLRAGYGFSGFCGWVFELQRPMTVLLLRAVSTDKNNLYYYTLDFSQFETKEGDKVVDPNAPAAGGKGVDPNAPVAGDKAVDQEASVDWVTYKKDAIIGHIYPAPEP